MGTVQAALVGIWDPLLGYDLPSCGLKVPSCHRGGPVIMRGVDITTAESLSLIMQMLESVWVNSKHQNHVQKCLEMAAMQGHDVVDHQFFSDRRGTCVGRANDTYLSYVAIHEAGMRNVSMVASMDKDAVYSLVKNMGGGWRSCYTQYAQSFWQNGINGSLFCELADEDLKGLGVSVELHRRRIKLEIRTIREGKSVPTFDILICSAGVESCNNAMSDTKDEVERMLLTEMRHVCMTESYDCSYLNAGAGLLFPACLSASSLPHMADSNPGLKWDQTPSATPPPRSHLETRGAILQKNGEVEGDGTTSEENNNLCPENTVESNNAHVVEAPRKPTPTPTIWISRASRTTAVQLPGNFGAESVSGQNFH